MLKKKHSEVPNIYSIDVYHYVAITQLMKHFYMSATTKMSEPNLLLHKSLAITHQIGTSLGVVKHKFSEKLRTAKNSAPWTRTIITKVMREACADTNIEQMKNDCLLVHLHLKHPIVQLLKYILMYKPHNQFAKPQHWQGAVNSANQLFKRTFHNWNG